MYNQETTGRWFMETTIHKLKDAQQTFDNLMFSEADRLSSIQIEEKVPMRIDPELNNNDIKTMANTISSIPLVQDTQNDQTYSRPPKSQHPRIGSCIIYKPDYNQATLKI